MALSDILQISDSKKIGVSEERIKPILPVIRDYVSFWREYPDIFVDHMSGGQFNLFFYQRVFMRGAMRHKYVFATFPRAFSKSFLSIMLLMIRCILYPRAALFVTSGNKEQSASIIAEKVNEICLKIPAFDREIDYSKGQKGTQFRRDKVRIAFKNGSYFDNIAARESSRGQRRHGGLVEECVGVDGEILSSVIIPTMNVARPCMDGVAVPEETLNKSQIYITTAGWKGTYSYDKLISFLVCSVPKPDKYFVMGGTYKIPVMEKLLDASFIQDIQNEGTFNEAAFEREYCSRWSGTAEKSFFNGEAFDKCRQLKQPEYEASGRSMKGSYYVFSADIGRKSDASVVTIFKVTPQPTGPSLKSVVNIKTWSDIHIEDQILEFKRLYFLYKPRAFVIDANGIGINYVDLLVKSQIDPETGDEFPGFGVINDKDGEYKKFLSNSTIRDVLYLVKANAQFNTEMYSNLQVQINSGKVKFLTDERVAKAKLLNTRKGEAMSPEEREKYLRPFTLTSILKEEMMNLTEENEGQNIRLVKINKRIKKDKVSSLGYGLYYIKTQEETKKKKKFNVRDYIRMN